MQRKEERPRGKPINLFIYKERHVDIYAYPLSRAFWNSWAECRFCGRPHAPLGGLVALSLAPRFTKKKGRRRKTKRKNIWKRKRKENREKKKKERKVIKTQKEKKEKEKRDDKKKSEKRKKVIRKKEKQQENEIK